MAKREKVILILAGIALLYGAFSLFPFSGSKRAPVNTGEELNALNKLITDVSLSLGKDAPDKTVTFMIAAAEAEWTKDPFFDKKPSAIKKIEENPKTAATAMTFVYSGYLEMEGKRICIINGMEYESGEEMATGGYVVRKIDPKNVVIEVKADGQKVVVPLQE